MEAKRNSDLCGSSILKKGLPVEGGGVGLFFLGGRGPQPW